MTSLASLQICSSAHLALIEQLFRDHLANRSVIKTLVEALESASEQDKERFLPIIRAVLALLATDPILVSLRMDLMLAGIPVAQWPDILRVVAEQGWLHADALYLICETVARGNSQPCQPADLAALEAALSASPDAQLRRIAFAAWLAQAKRTAGWTADLRQRLLVFRADPAPLVAAVAQFTFPPTEDGEAE